MKVWAGCARGVQVAYVTLHHRGCTVVPPSTWAKWVPRACAICLTFMYALTRSCVGICANFSILGVHLLVYEHESENVSWNVTSWCVRGYVLARVEYTRVWMSLCSLLRR